MNIEAAFRTMLELENGLAELYGSWAEQFSSDAEAAFVFFKMSAEEKGHASLIDYQRRVLRSSRAPSGDVEIDVAEMESTLEGIRLACSVSKRNLALSEAISIALRLEGTAAESHYKVALRQAQPGLAMLLGSLAGEDSVHVNRLKEFAAKRGIRAQA